MENENDGLETQYFQHLPVLVEEVIAGLKCKPGGRYVDATVGYGGLAERLLECSRPNGYVIGLDLDEEALQATGERLKSFGARLSIVHGNFRELNRHVAGISGGAFDGVVFDLGVSSPQLDHAQRGFSFQVQGPLDMRMDRSAGPTAAQWLAGVSEAELARVLFTYGDERYARRIAAAIVRERGRRRLDTTAALAQMIRDAVPAHYRHGRIHCATRTFQAIRIAVNGELESLEPALRQAADILVPGGRMCVIAFHSLEDRIVKQTFRALSDGPEAVLRLVTKKPITPTDAECRANRRARSAKLRIAERVAARRCA